MKRGTHILQTGGLAIVALIALACARYEFNVTVEDDGSGEFGILFAVPAEADQPLEAGDAPETAEPYLDEEGWHGWTMTIPFSQPGDIELIRAALNPDQQALHDFTLDRTDSGGWRYEHTIPAFDRLDTTALDFGTEPDVGHYLIRVTLPGDPLSHNADRIERGAFVWEIDVTSTSPTVLTAETDGGEQANAGDEPDVAPEEQGDDGSARDAVEDDAATADSGEGGGLGLGTAAAAGLVLLLLIFGGIWMLIRRRGGSQELT